MTNDFRKLFEGLREAGEGLTQAVAGFTKAAQAALDAQGETDDLRETVHRLEGLVLEQGNELRALRADLRRRNGGDQ